MQRSSAKKIVKRYAAELKKNHYPYSAIYLFGSNAKGTAGKWSDIDVAIVTERMRRARDRNSFFLWKTRRSVDIRIEPHGFTPDEFADDANPLAYEVKRTGIRIE